MAGNVAQSLYPPQSLDLGMPPMVVAIQQGGQIAGLFAGAFKEAAGAVLGFARANPVNTQQEAS
jgi:hypothetical protein